MHDECLLELYGYLIPEARRGFRALTRVGTATMEQLMRSGSLTTQEARKAVWGLACTGLVVHQTGLPLRLAPQGERLRQLLAAQRQAEETDESKT